MVTLEKWTGLERYVPASTLAVRTYESPGGLYECQAGANLSACGCCAEDEIVAVAAAIKQINPRVLTVAYLNTQISYPWYRAAREVASNPSWWLSDVHPRPPKSRRTWKLYDLTVPAAAASWKQSCLNLTRTGVIDSCFADGCTMRYQGGPPARIEALAAAKRELLREVQAEVRGPVMCGSDGTMSPGVDGVQAEGWGVQGHDGTYTFATREIPLAMAAVAAGRVFQAHGRAACGAAGDACEKPPCPEPAVPDYHSPAVQNEIAAFLVAMGEHSYYVCGSWENELPTTAWLPLFDLPLGKPLANATLDGLGVWRRAFASGTHVTFDTANNVGRVFWALGEI